MAAESHEGIAKERLIEAIKKLTWGVESVLRGAKEEYETCVNLEDYLSLDAKGGIKQMFKAMPLYAECLASLGVKKRSEQDQLCRSLSHDPEVRECYDALLNAEEAFDGFSTSVNHELQEEEGKKIPPNVTTLGQRLPEELSLVDSRTGGKIRLTSLYAQSTFTIMVLMRHFG